MNLHLPEGRKRSATLTTASLLLFCALSSAVAHAETPAHFNEPNHFQNDTLRVQGIVYDNAGTPLSGVSIQLKGSNTGTTSRENGGFSIPVPDRQGTLVFNYVGLAAKEEAIAGRSIINVYLKDKNASLKEIVVVGYANKTKSSVTGAISQIDNKAFESRPIVNTATALQGAVPGLTVMRGSGQPGGQGYDLQIRGYSSVNGNKPLILIDGVAGDLNTINPDDIANLTVLKDAAASIYGARAADGVILVTTKKGKSGAPSVNYSGNFGRKTPSYLKKVTTTQQFAEMTNESLTNVGLPGVPAEVFEKIKAKAAPDPDKGWVTYLHDYPGFYTDNNWNDILYGNALQQTHNVSVTGGGDNSAYLFSGGYMRDNGVFRFGDNHADRYNLRMNYDFKLLNKINVQTRNSYTYDAVTEPTLWQDMMSNLPRTFNFIPLKNPLGDYYTYQGYVNPAQQLEEGGSKKYSNNTFSFNVKMDAEIIKGLKVTGLMGINIHNYNESAVTRTFNLYNWQGDIQGYRNPLNSAFYMNRKDIYNTYSGFIEYNRTFNQHQFGLMAGSSLEKYLQQEINVTGSNFQGNEIFTLNLADKTKADYMGMGGGLTDWALGSYFSRFTYAFDNKLFLDATLRVDGSSKFSPDQRWSAAFPAVMAAYTITQEKFMERFKWLSHLKLRASWGQSGNQEIGAFSNYGYIPLINVSGSYPLGVPNTKTPGAVSGIASTTRTWETLETTNFGVDFGFLDNRLTGSLDIYEKRNKNMLVNVQVPATLGGSAPTQNLGVLSTKGFELSLGWKDQIGKFRYSVTAMLSDINNKLVELKGNDVLSMGLNYTHKGYPINSYFGYEATGIIQNAEQLAAYKQLGNVPANIGIGDMMFRDIDGDGKLTPYGDPTKGSKGDLKYLGTILPRYTYSSNINLAYGAFDLNVLIQGVGKQVNMRTGSFATPMSAIYFQPLDYFYGKSWTPENPGAQYPHLVPGAVGFDNIYNYNWQSSSMRITNLAYLRFKVITVGYNLPGTFCKKLHLSSARVYLSGQDLFTISKGTWNGSFDPEEGWKRQDEQTYPFTKVTSIGVNIRF